MSDFVKIPTEVARRLAALARAHSDGWRRRIVREDIEHRRCNQPAVGSGNGNRQ